VAEFRRHLALSVLSSIHDLMGILDDSPWLNGPRPMHTGRHRESKAGQRRHPPTVVTRAARDGVCGALERLSASDSRSASKNHHYRSLRNSKAEALPRSYFLIFQRFHIGSDSEPACNSSAGSD
jgi:hypothetical protein